MWHETRGRACSATWNPASDVRTRGTARLNRQTILFSALLAMGLVTMAALLWHSAAFLTGAWAAIRFPFQIDYGEGSIISQAMRWLSGGPLYPRLSAEGPYIVNNYPPVIYLLLGAVMVRGARLLYWGRALSVLSTVGCAALVAYCVWIALKGRKTVRAGAALVAALLFMRFEPVSFWAPLVRIDGFALFFDLAGLAWFLRYSTERRSLWAAVFFVLAAFSRQSMVAAALACVAASAVINWRWSAWLAGLTLAGMAVALAISQFLTGGNYWFNVVTATATQFSWRFALEYIRNMAFQYRAVLAVSAFFFVVSIVGVVRRFRPPDRDVSSGVALTAYWLFHAILMLTVGKIGSNANYFLGFLGASAILVGSALGKALALLQHTAPTRRLQGMAVAILILGAIVFDAFPFRQPLRLAETGSESYAAESALVSEMWRVSGEVISEEMLPVLQSGRLVVFQPFEMTQLAYVGKWNEAPFIDRLRARAYSLVVLRFDVMHPPPFALSRFTPLMMETIARNYEFYRQIGIFHLYLPRAPERKEEPGVSKGTP